MVLRVKSDVPLSIDELTIKELQKKGEIKLLSFASINNYIAIYNHNYYVLTKNNGMRSYELLRK